MELKIGLLRNIQLKSVKITTLDHYFITASNSNLKKELGSKASLNIKSNHNKVINRLRKRKNFSKKILSNLRKNQASLLKKRKLANYIVDNNFSPNIMKKKISLLKNKILDERNST